MTSARRYAREIETRWAALLERPAVLGERDWSVICDWHARGIPLPLIGEAFDQFSETLRRRRTKPRNLSALVPCVEDAWRTVCGGRYEPAEHPSAVAGRRGLPAAAWERCAAALAPDDPLRSWLRGLLERLAEGESAERCEAALEAGLLERLPEAVRDDLEHAVAADLRAFRGRMTRRTWDTTQRLALISAARRRFGLPVLSEPAATHPPDETF